MKIGVFSVLFYDKNFEDMLDYVSQVVTQEINFVS